MAKYAITPWRHHRDLLAVRQQLYGDSEQRNAVDRVMAWKLRGNLPHAVESTALLVDAILHHSIEGNSIFSVRAVYSAAFSRFVTGFCDIGRHKERSLEPSSMLDIAKQIGMPPAFVALRHEATHEELPAIQRLIIATKDALDWLWNVYWSRLEGSEPKCVLDSSLSQLRAQAKEFYKSWRSARRKALRTKEQRQRAEEVQAAVKSCIVLIREKGPESIVLRAGTLADVLVGERLLLPSKRELGSSLNGAFLIWDALLGEIIKQQKCFLKALIQSSLTLVKAASSQRGEDAEVEGLCLWTLHMLDLAPTQAQQRSLQGHIVQWCCSHPGAWSYFMGTKLIESGESDFVEDWKDVLEASQLRESQVESGGDVETTDTASVAWTHDTAKVPGWLRAVTGARTPIGVVQ